jgi:hypothetical protein
MEAIGLAGRESDAATREVAAVPAADRRASLLDSRLLALSLLAVFAFVFLVQAAPRIVAPFGDSHDGENGTVWGFASRAIREDGFVASRGGALLADGQGLYAHHPPLIAVETAVGESIVGEHPASTRAPAWVGSLVSIMLLYVLLRTLGFRRVPSAVAVLFSLSCPLFLLYGSMLDTLQIALPLVLGFLIVRARAESGRQTPRAGEFCVAALVVLSSWEGALLCALFASVDVVSALRKTKRFRPSATTGGLITGLTLIACWLWWANGSFAQIVEQARLRSGNGGRTVSWPSFLNTQGVYLGVVVGPVILITGAVGLVLALRTLRRKQVMACTTAVVLAYPVLMRDGAVNHDYWNYWLLIPLGFGVAHVAQKALIGLATRYRSEYLAVGVILTACVASLGIAVFSTNPARDQFDAGLNAQRLARNMALERPSGPIFTTTKYVHWANYSLSTRPRLRLLVTTRLNEEAAQYPHGLVLVKCSRRPASLDTICDQHPSQDYFVVRLTALQKRVQRESLTRTLRSPLR